MLVERQDRKIKLITGLSFFSPPLTERVVWLVFIVASGSQKVACIGCIVGLTGGLFSTFFSSQQIVTGNMD
jgi:hypothetical protein